MAFSKTSLEKTHNKRLCVSIRLPAGSKMKNTPRTCSPNGRRGAILMVTPTKATPSADDSNDR